MNSGRRLTASTVLLMLTVTIASYGWGAVGHMAVAYVAYNKLTPQTRAKVDALIQLNPKIHQWEQSLPAGAPAKRAMMLFMIAATWSDQIKGDHQHFADGPENGNNPPTDGTAARIIGYTDSAMHKYWHFVDVPFSQDGTALHNPPIPNAQTMIPALRAVLASTGTAALKSYGLVWLAHLVGDVHQPLHCTSRFSAALPNGDIGGNAVKLSGGAGNLHSFWDDLPGNGSDVTAAITWGQSLSAAPASSAANLDVAKWVNESFSAAKSKAYAKPVGAGAGPFTLTAAYRSAAMAVAKQRVALAGARLANILNHELK